MSWSRTAVERHVTIISMGVRDHAFFRSITAGMVVSGSNCALGVSSTLGKPIGCVGKSVSLAGL